jgi:diguanylate cyclase
MLQHSILGVGLERARRLLRDRPVDELKLDRVFVAHLACSASKRDTAIVRSALALGHALGLSVVAEGVEHEGALDLVCSLGFDAAQGYHLGRPVPADQLLLDRAYVGTEAGG